MHAVFEFSLFHLAVCNNDFHLGYNFGQHFRDIVDARNAIVKKEYLAAPPHFAKDGLADQ